jgi:hypothetical protein
MLWMMLIMAGIATEVDLELATNDQLIQTLVGRQGNPLIVIHARNKNLEVSMRNVDLITACKMLTATQSMVLNNPVQYIGDDCDHVENC